MSIAKNNFIGSLPVQLCLILSRKLEFYLVFYSDCNSEIFFLDSDSAWDPENFDFFISIPTAAESELGFRFRCRTLVTGQFRAIV